LAPSPAARRSSITAGRPSPARAARALDDTTEDCDAINTKLWPVLGLVTVVRRAWSSARGSSKCPLQVHAIVLAVAVVIVRLTSTSFFCISTNASLYYTISSLCVSSLRHSSLRSSVISVRNLDASTCGNSQRSMPTTTVISLQLLSQHSKLRSLSQRWVVNEPLCENVKT
jgi:hypothetical protein